jgi:transcriptional regulator with XRE-family HTH domain
MGVNEYIQIGSKIKAIRTERGLKQRQVATDLNIPYSTYSNYENNNREPSLYIITQIAKYFDVTIDELIFGRW